MPLNSPYLYQNNFENIFRTFLFLSFLISFWRHYESYNFFVIISFTCYLILYFIISYLKGHYYLDIINANLFFIYTITFVKGSTFLRKIESSSTYIYSLKFFLITCLLIYLYKFFITGNNRPSMFAENNFELILISFVFFALIFKNYIIRTNLWWLFFFIIILLSGSKSGALIFIFLFLYKLEFKIKYIIFISILLLLFLSVIVNFITSIDRYTFLINSVITVYDRSFMDLVFPLNLIPLPRTVCDSLSYYTGSMNPEALVCYPKMLHMWVVTSFFNHGMIIMLAFLIIFYRILKKFFNNDSIVLITIPLINGLSVSGFDSSWLFISYIIILPLWNNNSLHSKS